ncbi:MAG: zinc carboxypeptidase, partial [Candidatus Aminicenantes bacterium]|nr:zinc carboxypeptidase [Candidatus Aminicenantes bacterium]
DIISVDKNQTILEKLWGMNLDLLMERNGKIFIVASIDDLIKLEEKNIAYTLETQNFYPLKQENITIQSGINGAFHSYKEIEQDLLAIESAYPNLARVIDIGDSLENRNIYALKISDNVQMEEDEAGVLFLGCHHAREWISVEVPFLIGKYLVENYATNSEIKELVDQSEIWIIPLVNPDGLEYSIHFYRYWRKNMRDNGDGSYGVDLNRNYGFKWGYDNAGSSPIPFSGTYRGKSPFSEPETQAIRDLFTQKNFQALITYHSYSQVILYSWGYTKEPSYNNGLLANLAKEMSALMEPVNGRLYEYGQAGDFFYLTNGDTTDWSFGVYGIPSYTIELPPVDQIHGGFFNAEEDINSIFNENLPSALYLIDWAIQQKQD